MSKRTTTLTENLYEYMLSVSLRDHPALAELRQETEKMPNGNMQVSPEQGQFMGLLARIIGASYYLEVGTFTGYSSISVGLALPDDAKIVCCDISREYTDIARKYWDKAGITGKVELRIGTALESLTSLLSEGAAGSFDMMFIDADKESYLLYYEEGLKLLREGGVMLVDNVFWGGSVAKEDATDADTEAIRKFNKALSNDARIDLSVLPIADGLSIVRKR